MERSLYQLPGEPQFLAERTRKWRVRPDAAVAGGLILVLTVLCLWAMSGRAHEAPPALTRLDILKRASSPEVQHILDQVPDLEDVHPEIKDDPNCTKSLEPVQGVDEGPPVVAYDEEKARSFAYLAHITGCGDTPGLPGSVSSCGSPEGIRACSDGNVAVIGTPLVILVDDMHIAKALSAYVAKISVDGAEGCLLAIRGTIDNFANTQRNSQRELTLLSHESWCKDCKVHQGFWSEYTKMRKPILAQLTALGCAPSLDQPQAKLWFTGFGTGGSLAALAAYHLHAQYDVQPSYLFHTLRVGNRKFVSNFQRKFGRTRPFWFITEGKDLVPLLPKGKDYASLPYEVHYTGPSEYEVCHGSVAECGLAKYKDNTLSRDWFCQSWLAPHGSFCQMAFYTATCFGGRDSDLSWGSTPYDNSDDGLPVEVSPDVHKVFLDIADTCNPYNIYNEYVAKCFGMLGRTTYCFQKDFGRQMLVKDVSTNFCEPAGAEIDTLSIQSMSWTDDGVPDAMFAIVGVLKQVPCKLCNADTSNPFPPGDSLFLAIRGSYAEPISTVNDKHGHDDLLVPLDDCDGGNVHGGYQAAWKLMEPRILRALSELSETYQITSKRVFVQGYSFGAGMGVFALWYLQQAGFQVQLSYLFAGPRIGDEGFNSCLKASLPRSPGFFRVVYEKDRIPKWPHIIQGYYNLGLEVWYDEKGTYTICKPQEERCGSNRFKYQDCHYYYHTRNPIMLDGTMPPLRNSSDQFWEVCLGSPF